MDRATKKPKLNCRNWECGVLLPVCESNMSNGNGGTSLNGDYPSSHPKSDGKTTSEITSDHIDIATIFGDTLPVPMKVPAPLLGPQDRPWFNSEY
jgi:hypothetical protein